MSLDIYIKLHEVKEPPRQTACGSNICMNPEASDIIHMNITHNMAIMASHVPCLINNEPKTLYDAVWHPAENGCANTTPMENILRTSLVHMIYNQKELEKYNPENGWGSYSDFTRWLFSYWINCLHNPDCGIETDS